MDIEDIVVKIVGAAIIIGIIMVLSSPSQSDTSSTSSDTSSMTEGQSAGYEYAQQYDISDPDYSNGKSDDFNEGVHSYVEGN